jgi:hypothetical protein
VKPSDPVTFADTDRTDQSAVGREVWILTPHVSPAVT